METDKIGRRMRELHPELCDDDIECTCGGKHNGQPEWRHQVRFAIWDLSHRGDIEKGDDGWCLIN